jgi:hypothetical protein
MSSTLLQGDTPSDVYMCCAMEEHALTGTKAWRPSRIVSELKTLVIIEWHWIYELVSDIDADRLCSKHYCVLSKSSLAHALLVIDLDVNYVGACYSWGQWGVYC